MVDHDGGIQAVTQKDRSCAGRPLTRLPSCTTGPGLDIRRRCSGGDESFFADAQSCYVRWDPDTPTALTLKSATDIPSSHYLLDRTDRFGPPVLRRYEWDRSYTTVSYLELLLTYSGHRALEPKAQSSLLGCIAHLIDTGYGGQITKRYLTELRVAPTIGQ